MPTPTQPCCPAHPTLSGLLLALLLASPLGARAEEENGEAEAWLRWRNGDELRGAILESGDDHIRWRAEPFAAPLRLRLEQLKGIRFPSSNRTEVARRNSRFRLMLRNGDRLEGRLRSMSAESVTLACAPIDGAVTIRREAIERIVHVDGDFLRYSGPDELSGWISTGRDREPSEWFTDLRGAFATHQWSGNLFREIRLPERVEISFRARFPRGRPNIEIGLVRDPERGPRLETWDDYLVLTHRSRFVPVMEVTDATRELDFRLFWNQESGEVRLCEPSGRALASLDDVVLNRSEGDDSADPLDRGFSILNRTPSLKLESLTVREWDGSEIPVIDLSRPRLVLAGESPRFRIDDVSLPAGSDSLSVGGRSVPLARLQELVLTPAEASRAASTESRDATRVAWYSGSTISGTFRRIDRDGLALRPAWSENPVNVRLADAKEIRFPTPRAPVDEGRDHLTGDGFSLRGAPRLLADAPDGEGLIGWQPPGADEPSPFAADVEATITRPAHSASPGSLSSFIGQARLYLANDEILVGKLISIENGTVHFTSRITGQLEIPAESVRAIDIGSAGRVLVGFGDSEWEEIEESESEVSATEESVVLQGGAFGNPSLLLGDRIHFDLEWAKSYGAVTLRLFADGADPDSPSTDVIVAAQGNRLFVGKLKEGGAFSFSGDQIPIGEQKASFEIRAQPEKIEVTVNGKSSLDIAVDPDRVSGNGIYFKMGGGWQGWNQAENQVTISGFRIERSPGSVTRRIIDREAKRDALTIPRSHRDDTPTHVLVAPNGDLLRGRLESAANEKIRFTSNGETFDFPAHRVSALVWLRGHEKAPPSRAAAGDAQAGDAQADDAKSPDASGDEAAAPEPQPKIAADFPVTHRFVLMNGSRLLLAEERAENGRFVGRSAVLGPCRIASENVRSLDMAPATPIGELADLPEPLYDDWEVTFTPDPDIPDPDGATDSPWIGEEAPPVELSMLDGSEFRLEDHRGRIVVLDFWATWCGPCTKAMPAVASVVEAFPAGAVTFRAVNQAESPPIIESFLEKRDWTGTPVALDFDMEVSRAYEVEAIPYTVVIGRGGKVRWVHRGFDEQFEQELFQAINRALRQ